MKFQSQLVSKDTYLLLVVLHVIIGYLLFIFRHYAEVYFLVLMMYFIVRIILAPSAKKSQEVLLGCAYFVGAEVLFRMTKGGLAYEASKYLVILFMLMGMFFKGISGKSYPYFLYLLLLFPAILVASVTLTFDANFRTNVAFVLSGPVCLGIAALFCYDRKISHSQLMDVVLYIALPCITLTTYLFFYSPSIKETLSGTASNYAASGGFGPNQVSTALGLGIIAIVIRFFMASPNLLLKIINLIILIAMSYRAVVTFSRGGVFAALIVIAGFLWVMLLKSNYRQKVNIIGSFIVFCLAMALAWIISSNQSLGLIDKRYANQDALGRDKEDITTGRVGLFMEEIDGFLSNPFLGIGASRVKNKRVEYTGMIINSHNEIGRTLSEHGFLGVVIFLILIIKPLIYRSNNKKNYFFYAFYFFWFATINHSGMRIAAPAFLYALCLLNVTYEKNNIHWKQLKE